MKQKLIIQSSLFILSISIILFLIIYTFFYTDDYYEDSLFVNFFFLPTLYVGTSIYTIICLKKKQFVGFIDAFSTSFLTMFLSGTLFTIFVLLFMNFYDSEVAYTFQYQRINLNLKNATQEYAPYLKQNDQEKIKAFEIIKKTLISEQEKNKNIFTFKNSFIFLGILYIGYLFLSLILSLFLRNKTN